MIRFFTVLLFFTGLLYSASEDPYLYCSGDYGSTYRLDKMSLEIIWYSRYGDTLAQVTTLGSTGFNMGVPSDISYQSPDRLLILDKQKRSFYEFNRNLVFISVIQLSDPLISPVRFTMQNDNSILIYDDFHQQLFRYYRDQLTLFAEESLFYATMDRNIALKVFDNIVHVYLPGEGLIYQFNSSGQLLNKISLPPTVSGTETSFAPMPRNRYVIYSPNSLTSYDYRKKSEHSLSVLGLRWCQSYQTQAVLMEGSDKPSFRIVSIR